MNAAFANLKPYPFERLRVLKENLEPAKLPELSLAIGEPKHAAPAFVERAITENLQGLSNYPLTKGTDALRNSIAHWLNQRFQLNGNIDAETQVLPVNGTREALFAFAQTVIDSSQPAAVLMPNPFYQIYEGAALFANAEPVYLATTEDNGFIPDFDAIDTSIWEKCQLLYLCSPGNPTGAVTDEATLQHLIQLSEQYNFIIASDECYSEIYFNEGEPPVGLLQAAHNMGHTHYKNCVVFHSLSKRSNLPGLRSGFVAGDKEIISKFLLYRTYHGSAMSPVVQAASIAAWNDETHVQQNRQYYRDKFDTVLEILQPLMNIRKPQASFYLWPETPENDIDFTLKLYQQQHVNVVPGSLLSRDVNGNNPGTNRIRMALVAEQQACVEAAERIASFIQTNY